MFFFFAQNFFCAFLIMLLTACSGQESPSSPSAWPPSPATLTKVERPLPEPLVLDAPILVALSQQEAHRRALALRKDRQGFASWTALEPYVQRSLAYARSWPQHERAIEHNGKVLPWSRITASLELLLELLPALDTHPALLAEHFEWFYVQPQVHFTSYYSPSFKASRTKKEGYAHPLYRLPEVLAPALAHCLHNHSCPEEAFAQVIRPDEPYFTREEIDLDGALSGKGLEIAWLQHPFDVYSLMLQGSGYLNFDDGTGQAILFAGLNGARGQSMAGYLIRTGEVARKDATIEGMRAWWDANPQKRRAFLHNTSGYVFFRYGASKPQATIGADLTPWVSLAVDERVLPLGGIVAYGLPTTGKQKAGIITGHDNSLNGLGLAQDTGGAIKMRRIDLYAGEGQEGHDKAMSVYTKGQVWLLLKREEE